MVAEFVYVKRERDGLSSCDLLCCLCGCHGDFWTALVS